MTVTVTTELLPINLLANDFLQMRGQQANRKKVRVDNLVDQGTFFVSKKSRMPVSIPFLDQLTFNF